MKPLLVISVLTAGIVISRPAGTLDWEEAYNRLLNRKRYQSASGSLLPKYSHGKVLFTSKYKPTNMVELPISNTLGDHGNPKLVKKREIEEKRFYNAQQWPTLFRMKFKRNSGEEEEKRGWPPSGLDHSLNTPGSDGVVNYLNGWNSVQGPGGHKRSEAEKRFSTGEYLDVGDVLSGLSRGFEKRTTGERIELESLLAELEEYLRRDLQKRSGFLNAMVPADHFQKRAGFLNAYSPETGAFGAYDGFDDGLYNNEFLIKKNAGEEEVQNQILKK